MLKNYFKTAIRNLIKHRVYSIINVFGLAIGIATCIIIFLFVQDELSYDRFHKDAENIFRWETAWEINGESGRWAASGGGWIPRLVENYPEITAGVKINKNFMNTTFRKGNIQFNESRVYFADSTFFEVFSFETITPNHQSFLTEPGMMVLTESTAKKYFGNEDPIGKTLDSDQRSYTITGVIKDIPTNSHFHFDILISMETVRLIRPGVDEDGPLAWHSYFRVRDKDAAEQLREKLKKDIYILAGFQVSADSSNVPEGLILPVGMQPITDIHLYSNAEKELESNSDIKLIRIFIIVAIFILLIACINYMNLTTAKSSKRAREVGIRKTLGSDKKRIFFQFIGESFVLCTISLLLALFAAQLILPGFNQLTGKELVLNLAENIPLLFVLFGILLVVGFLSGLYPAVFMSRFKPVTILNSGSSIGSNNKFALTFRRILVVVQFAISVLLIISALTVYKQLMFIKDKEIGFNKEQVIILPRPNNKEDITKEELLKLPEVISASVTSSVPGDRIPYLSVRMPSLAGQTGGLIRDNNGAISMRVWGADEDIEETLGLTIIEGRGFSRDHQGDREHAFILNEAAVKALNLSDPIGKKFHYEYNLKVPKKGEIIGVIKDFHYASLHTEMEPLVIHFYRPYDAYLCLRLNSRNVKKTISKIKTVWKESVPSVPFDVKYLDETYDSLYKAENSMGKIVSYFTFLAIIIACLGLFGLASYIAEQRTKEIAIRKIFGASVFTVISHLSKEFLILVIISNLIAWFPAYYFLNKWLQNFAYRNEINFVIFIVSGISAVIIALLTILLQTIKSAYENPVKALKYE
ncbi:MAG: ABC transporter permease [Candidatus Cloacimonetes bacterium]|nr:ABC transporter permease [Candidatus Cloacimonadota bacterium]